MGSKVEGEGLALNSRWDASSSETDVYSNLIQQDQTLLPQQSVWDRSASSGLDQKILLLETELAEIVT